MIRHAWNRTLAAATALLILALVLLAVFAMTAAVGSTGSAAPQSVTAPVSGDDNGDGRIDEDESGWDCTAMGNRVCGPRPALAQH